MLVEHARRFLLPIALLLASCGGGGGSPGCNCTKFPAPPPQPAPPPTPAPQNPPTVPLSLALSTVVTGLDNPVILTVPARDGRQFILPTSARSGARKSSFT